MGTVYRKEMRAYLVSPIPYVLIIIFTAFMGWWFFDSRGFFLMRRASMETFFGISPWIFLFLVPAISMRLWSEESRAGTLEALQTAPVRSWQLVGGKFLSAWTLLLICLVATLPVPITVAILGDLDWGPVIGGYLGMMFLGAALLGLGLWISSLTNHQIVAFLITAVIA
ncbi:MAG: ABC transporter permease subunit, partial [Planctomycetota bacterium]